MIGSVNHITIGVSDLDNAFKFYTDILGMKPIAAWNKGAYLLAGSTWICLALEESRHQKKSIGRSHIAFSVDDKDFEHLASRITESGAGTWRENVSEGKSLYFLDPDGHRLEIHAGDLRSRLAFCRKKPYTGMKFFDHDI